MKRLYLKIALVFFCLSTNVLAQDPAAGLFLTANDFIKGRLSYVSKSDGEASKIYLNEFLNSPSIKVVKGDSIIRLKKEKVFGFKNKDQICYRFYNKEEYKIINPTEQILMYTRTFTTGGTKNLHIVTAYYFSSTADSPIYELTKWNLKAVLTKDVHFHELLDVYFHSDIELASFDTINKIFCLNRVYLISKQKVD